LIDFYEHVLLHSFPFMVKCKVTQTFYWPTVHLYALIYKHFFPPFTFNIVFPLKL